MNQCTTSLQVQAVGSTADTISDCLQQNKPIPVARFAFVVFLKKSQPEYFSVLMVVYF